MTAWTTQDTRQRAIAIVIRRGWAPGAYQERGAICADSAIALAAREADGGTFEEGGAWPTTLSEPEGLLGRGSLTEWEMKSGRTAEEVIELLRSGYVAGGAHAPLSPEEQEQARLAGERLTAALARLMEALKHMQERSGPIYDLARERSAVLQECSVAVGLFRAGQLAGRLATVATTASQLSGAHGAVRIGPCWRSEQCGPSVPTSKHPVDGCPTHPR